MGLGFFLEAGTLKSSYSDVNLSIQENALYIKLHGFKLKGTPYEG
jgi:hypothetical protein